MLLGPSGGLPGRAGSPFKDSESHSKELAARTRANNGSGPSRRGGFPVRAGGALGPRTPTERSGTLMEAEHRVLNTWRG
eukprot:15439705-Alexandrium_andersonii.AAC.1